MPAKSTSTTARRGARALHNAAGRPAPTPADTPRSRKTAPERAAPGRVRTARSDAIALLREDHRRIAALFAQFDTLKADGERKRALVARICRELTVHARVEEEIFYPAARTVLDDAALVDEADVEHACAKALVAELEAAKPGDDHHDAKVRVLGEYVEHHVREEQEAMFPMLRRTGLDLQGLGERIAARKRELAGVASDAAASDDALRRFIPMV